MGARFLQGVQIDLALLLAVAEPSGNIDRLKADWLDFLQALLCGQNRAMVMALKALSACYNHKAKTATSTITF